MNQSEILLQELVNLKKKEMHRTRMNRIVHFTFGTLPIFILMIFSIYAGYSFMQEASELLQNLPTGFEGFGGGDENDLFETIKSQLP